VRVCAPLISICLIRYLGALCIRALRVFMSAVCVRCGGPIDSEMITTTAAAIDVLIGIIMMLNTGILIMSFRTIFCTQSAD
jgi:hypothetical protein